ncbi:MAG: hypothetical protein K8R63_08715 [Bacteroidales bacterium]|nr:hypothetical protein [Bacteroidales bacterium]
MRKLIFILAFLVAKNLFCNPILMPPVISEFYLNEGDWQLEVYFSDDWSSAGIYNFSDLRLICNNDTAYFIAGLSLEWNTLIVIDQNSLSTPFNVDLLEDWIYIETFYCLPLDEGIRYGGPPYFPWHTTTPKTGESIVRQYFNVAWGDDFYGLLKETSPSIGYNAFECSTRGTFSGYVFDQFNNPVPEIRFTYCDESYCWGNVTPSFMCFETDENGYFEADELFCKWHIFKLVKDDIIFAIDTMFFEPDSAYYKEYTLNSVGVPDNDIAKEISIQLAPNPFTYKTSFRISIPDYYRWNEAEISIRNMNGQLVDVIHIPNAVWSGDDFSIDWYPARVATNVYPGLYLYTLEVDGKYVSSDKMIFNE